MSFFFQLPINTNMEPLKFIISATYTANRLIFTVWMRKIDPIYNIWFSLMLVGYVNVILPLMFVGYVNVILPLMFVGYEMSSYL